MRAIIPVVATVLTVSLSACATGGVATGVTPAAITRLERERQANPTSAALNRSLGIAYYQTGRYPDARSALESASRLDPRDGTTVLYLGLTAEAQNDLPAARRAYASYVEFGRTSRVRSQLRERLAALARKELSAEAKAAVAQEKTLRGEAGSPRTVAVLPLRFRGADSSLRSLERGFADLLITDLARSAQLTLVERARLQALLDELALQRGGTTDPASNVRVGRLVRAGRVVQGALLELPRSQLRVDAAVVNVPTTQIQGATQRTDALDQLFDLEKKIALDLFRELGVTLTVAERNAIEQRPTRSLVAFLAYSRGLLAEDEGRYDEANRYFREAVRLDPGFGAAQQKSAETRAISAGTAVSAQTIEAGLRGSPEERLVTAAAQGRAATPANASLASTAQHTSEMLNGSTAGMATATGGAPAAVTLPVSTTTTAGAQTTTLTGKIVFTIPRPKLP
jgi:tetratricopeptide (TPR) repeat protein